MSMPIAERNVLETLIDRFGLTVVTETLRDICDDKSMHIAANWQDNGTAKAWERVAGRLGTLANYIGAFDIFTK